MDQIEERICTKCLKVLPVTTEFFGKNHEGPGGFDWRCKECKRGMHIRECLHCQKAFSRSKKSRGRKSFYCSDECFTLHIVGGKGAKKDMLTVIGYAGKKSSLTKQGYLSNINLITVACDCGVVKDVGMSDFVRKGRNIMRSCGCFYKVNIRSGLAGKGEKHPNWKHGKFAKSAKSYVLIYMPDHPNAQSSGMVPEHVLVMSEFLGRPMRPGENIHHRDGFRSHNNIENLELWTTHQPPGQRVEDVMAWCKAYIAQYQADVRKLKQAQSSAHPQDQLSLDTVLV